MANKVKKGYPLKQVSVRLKLLEETPLYGAEPVNTPQKALELVAGFLGEMDREHFIVIPLDAKLRPLNFSVASIGTAHQSIVDSPTVFKEIFLSNGFAYLTAHNHPSGDPAPSMDDYRLTKKLMEQSEILGISYFDHVIIGAGGKRRFSFREEMGEAFSIQGLGKALEGMGDSSLFTFAAEGGIQIPVLEVDERGMVKPQKASVREKIRLFKGALAGQGENALETAHDIPQPLSPMEAWERDVLKSEKDSFLIYQLKGGEETRNFRFEGLKYLFRDDVAVDKGNYDFVYAAPLPKGKSLEDIYMEFNDDCPEDYTGSSLSVSDIVVLRQNGENRAFYTDSIGFTEIPHFFDKELTPKEFSRERMAYAAGNFFIALQKKPGGISYSAYDKSYNAVLEGVSERSGGTIKDALLADVLPVFGVKGWPMAVDYGCLMERAEKARETRGREVDLEQENSQ
ncbi:MAG: hypothetical protein IJU50_01750, partial [Lachnospiraceae bacterium]|nr:hypothetical protein [Lachnospiraceae bacterium]